MASSLASHKASIILSHVNHATRTQALQVKAHRHKDDQGGWPSSMADANMSVLRQRMEEVKMKERLERCCRCENGWNYAVGYNSKLKIDKELSQFLNLVCLVCTSIGLTCLSATFVLCLVSFLIHLNQ